MVMSEGQLPGELAEANVTDETVRSLAAELHRYGRPETGSNRSRTGS